MKEVTIKDAPAVLNINDRAMWVLGFNAAVEAIRGAPPPLTDDQIDALYLSKLAGKNFDNIAVAFRAMVRAVEREHGIGGVTVRAGQVNPPSVPYEGKPIL